MVGSVGPASEGPDQAAEQPDLLGRRLNTAMVLFHGAVAEQMGLNLTDYKCLELLMRRKLTYPGQLSADAGLSTATTTLVLDRLQSKGLVVRTPDPHDRRRTVVRVKLTRELVRSFEQATLGMRNGMLALADSFSEAELDIVRRYLQGAAEALERALQDLRSGRRAAVGPKS